MSEASERLAAVRSEIARAARLAQRSPDDIELIAVSKGRDASQIEPLIAAGQRAFGENRLQEAQAKWGGQELRGLAPNLRLHFIGRLQSNKAIEATRLFDAIHSVDRPSLVDALARAMADTGRTPDCFIQVNVGAEAQKGGCPVDELPGLLDRAQGAGLRIAGLMCLPPADVEAAPYFALLAKLARRHDVTGLSMGMSNDFATAVMIGATHLRIGTALFADPDQAP